MVQPSNGTGIRTCQCRTPGSLLLIRCRIPGSLTLFRYYIQGSLPLIRCRIPGSLTLFRYRTPGSLSDPCRLPCSSDASKRRSPLPAPVPRSAGGARRFAEGAGSCRRTREDTRRRRLSAWQTSRPGPRQPQRRRGARRHEPSHRGRTPTWTRLSLGADAAPAFPLPKPGRPHLCMPATDSPDPIQGGGAGPSPPRCQNQGDHTCACRPPTRLTPSREGGPDPVRPAAKTRATVPPSSIRRANCPFPRY